MNNSLTNNKELISWAKALGYKVPYQFSILQKIGIFIGFIIVRIITGNIVVIPIVIFFFYRRRKFKNELKSLEKKWIDAGRPKFENLDNNENIIDSDITNDDKEAYNLELQKKIDIQNKKIEEEKREAEEAERKIVEQKKASFGFGIQEFEIIFVPSKAKEPKGFLTTGDDLKDLKLALKNPSISFRSFFNDIEFLKDGCWTEDALFCPPFDEALFCKYIKENHRKNLAEKTSERLKDRGAREDKYGMFGAISGLVTGNMVSGLMLGNMLARSGNTTRSADQPIEDFLSDPSLIFSEDQGSFISLSGKYRTQTLKRRICIKKRTCINENVYFDLIPMILFENCATPGQVFKFLDGYSFRPISAGSPSTIKSGLGYNPVKIRRSLTYNPKTDIGKTAKVINTKIIGETVEKDCTIMYAWGKDDKSLNHFYFDYPVDELF